MRIGEYCLALRPPANSNRLAVLTVWNPELPAKNKMDARAGEVLLDTPS